MTETQNREDYRKPIFKGFGGFRGFGVPSVAASAMAFQTHGQPMYPSQCASSSTVVVVASAVMFNSV